MGENEIPTSRITKAKQDRLYLPEAAMFILTIDDNNTVTKFLNTILRRHFAPVIVDNAYSNQEAYNLMRNTEYHLILLDNTLPDISCEDVISDIRNSGNDVPIILIAISETMIPLEIIMSHGADDIVYKPLNVIKLVETIQRTLNVDLEKRGTTSKFHKTINVGNA